jgi:hypothetical protein
LFENSGDRLVEVAHSPNVLGVYYRAPVEEDGDGLEDSNEIDKDRTELETLLRGAGLELRVIARGFEIGRGAQGDPVTLLQIVTLAATAVAAPAVCINQWGTAIPKIREWLLKRRAARGVTLELVKCWCVEDARSRVKDSDEISFGLVAGHRGAGYTTSMDVEPVGPYCVTIQVPSRHSTFVYVTDELGQVIHFHEAPGPGPDEVLVEDNV